MAIDASTRYPRSRIEKLGVKEGDRIGMVAFQDAAFERELAGRGATPVKGRLGSDLPMVLCAFREADELGRLSDLKQAIAPNGCVWALWPKGRRELREDDVRTAALAIGLVDVKVMAFSDVLSGLKLVIRKADRPGARPTSRDDGGAKRRDTEDTAVLRAGRTRSRSPKPVKPRKGRRAASKTK